MKTPTSAEVHADRFLRENPYAHMEHLEEADDPPRPKRRKYTLVSIEEAATGLMRELWKNREKFGLPRNIDPTEILNPQYAAQWFGFDYKVVSSLGHMARDGSRVTAAGMIDRSKQRITIATDVGPHVALFTAAHEIGHLVLHPNQTGLHRDRPISGPGASRNQTEYEADKFATFFLMPRKLLTAEFNRRFLGERFELNEATAYALLGTSCHKAERELPTRRALARKLAGAIQYNGRTFTSLVEHFGVSTEAMAIRLEELNLL